MLPSSFSLVVPRNLVRSLRLLEASKSFFPPFKSTALVYASPLCCSSVHARTAAGPVQSASHAGHLEFRSNHLPAKCQETSGHSLDIHTRNGSPCPQVLRPRRGYAAGHASVASADGIVAFNLADVGEGIAECEVLQWFVKEGDEVSQFQKVCEVQSDKANVEISSRYDGVVEKLYYKVGETAKVGKPLMDVRLRTASAKTAPSTSTNPVADSRDKAASHVPADTETAKATTEDKPKEDRLGGRVLAIPAVRALAKDLNVDITRVRGTGPNGRILTSDVTAASSHPQAQQPPPPTIAPRPSLAPEASTPTPTSAPAASEGPVAAAKAGGVDVTTRVEPVRGLMKAMVKTMTESNLIPHMTLQDDYDLGNLVSLRAQLKSQAESQGYKLTYLPFFLKAVSLSLRQYPLLNATYSPHSSEVTYHGQHNLAVAMDSPMGLIVPNVKHVENRSVEEIARELERLRGLAQAGKLKEEDLAYGTFTVSNVGTIGGIYATPKILPPQVAIGALGKLQKLPRFDEKGQVVSAQIMGISWSADHRVIDGATLARFSNSVRDILQNPMSLLLHLR